VLRAVTPAAAVAVALIVVATLMATYVITMTFVNAEAGLARLSSQLARPQVEVHLTDAGSTWLSVSVENAGPGTLHVTQACVYAWVGKVTVKHCVPVRLTLKPGDAREVNITGVDPRLTLSPDGSVRVLLVTDKGLYLRAVRPPRGIVTVNIQLEDEPYEVMGGHVYWDCPFSRGKTPIALDYSCDEAPNATVCYKRVYDQRAGPLHGGTLIVVRIPVLGGGLCPSWNRITDSCHLYPIVHVVLRQVWHNPTHRDTPSTNYTYSYNVIHLR